MKKEVFLAITFGLIVGLAVTFGVYLSKHKNDTNQKDASTAHKIALEPIKTEIDNNQTQSLIKITSPTNESVQTDKTINLSGESIPDSYTVIFINDEEKIINVDSSGKFSLDIDLESGSNILGAYVVSDDGTTYHNQITVIYTNKSLEEKLVSDSEIKVEADKQK